MAAAIATARSCCPFPLANFAGTSPLINASRNSSLVARTVQLAADFPNWRHAAA
jgi:hypothetical protein